MNAASAFFYACNRRGLCCRNKVIALSPYDVIRIARATEITTGETLTRYTLGRGSLLRFLSDGRCAALDGVRRGLHPGRPLACRLYPLGLERVRDADGGAYVERFVRLEPASGRSASMARPARSASSLTGRKLRRTSMRSSVTTL